MTVRGPQLQLIQRLYLATQIRGCAHPHANQQLPVLHLGGDAASNEIADLLGDGVRVQPFERRSGAVHPNQHGIAGDS